MLVADEVHGARLVEEALHVAGVPRHVEVDRLDGHLAADDGVLGLVDRAHSAGADKRQDPVGSDQRANHRLDDHRRPARRLLRVAALIAIPRFYHVEVGGREDLA